MLFAHSSVYITPRDGCPVTRVESAEGGVVVEAGGELFSCSSVILTPGPWAGGILDKLGVTLPLNPVKIPVYYWRLAGAVAGAGERAGAGAGAG